MAVDQTGSDEYPRRFTYSGQAVYEFEEHYIFILENHIYRTAGMQHWRDKVQSGEVSKEGISLNKRLFGKAVSSTDKPFLVYDKKRTRVFKLTDREIVSVVNGKEVKGNKKLIVMPLDAFTRGDISKVPQRLR